MSARINYDLRVIYIYIYIYIILYVMYTHVVLYLHIHTCACMYTEAQGRGSLVLFCLEPLLSLGLAGSFWSCFIRVLVSSESPEAKVGQL